MPGWGTTLVAAIAGALVGGAIAWLVTLSQRHFERDSRTLERSLAAAMAVLRACVALDATISLIRDAPVPYDEVAAKFNGLALTCQAEGAAIRDGDVRLRVDNHAHLLSAILRTAASRNPAAIPSQLLDAVDRHTTSVEQTLQCYLRQEPLPTYRSPPLNDSSALFAWGAG